MRSAAFARDEDVEVGILGSNAVLSPSSGLSSIQRTA